MLYYPPEGHHDYLVYEARLQPGLTAGHGAELVVSYNVTSRRPTSGQPTSSHRAGWKHPSPPRHGPAPAR